MIIISPASVTLLYLSRMVIGRGKFYPMMCGVFCLRIFTFRYPRFYPQMSSDPLTSYQVSGKFSICTSFSIMFTRCLWIVKTILYCILRASKYLV